MCPYCPSLLTVMNAFTEHPRHCHKKENMLLDCLISYDVCIAHYLLFLATAPKRAKLDKMFAFTDITDSLP